MAIEGIDFAWGRPSVRAIKNAGKRFVCRYVSTPENSKNITRGEALKYRLGGLDVVIVFETWGFVGGHDRGLLNRAGGIYHAEQAEKQVNAAGLKGIPIYFALDEDPATLPKERVLDYFKGINSVLGVKRTGCYAGLNALTWLFDAGLIMYGWQTYAWSHGRWEARAQLQQYDNYGNRIDGVDCDLDRAVADDFGQYGYKGPRPKPEPYDKPLPGPVPKPKWFWDALNEFLRRGNYKPGEDK